MQGVKDTARRALALFRENEMGVYAGYATLFIITALFPCLMLALSVVNALPGYSPSDLTDFLFSFLPDLTAIQSLVNTMVGNLKTQSTGLLASVSALTTLWSASSGVSALQKGLKRLTPGGKSRLPDKVLALIFTLLFVVLMPAVVVFQVLGDAIIELAVSLTAFFGVEELAGTISSIVRLSSAATVVAALGVLLLTYAYLPGGRRSIKSQIPGTIFAAVTWFVFTRLFAFFIPRFYHSSGIYGSLASLFLMLMWLRFVVTILLFGAAVNRALEPGEPETKEE